MKKTRLARVLWWGLTLGPACQTEAPEGTLACAADADCPRGWVCESRRQAPAPRCYAESDALRSDADAAAVVPAIDGGSLLDAALDTGVGSRPMSYPYLPDAGAFFCGRWKPARVSDPAPPANATDYGYENNKMGSYKQYVCRFGAQLDGTSLVLQGKGVFGFACYAVLPAGVDATRVEPSHEFEVLTDTAACADMVPWTGRELLLPTGAGSDGKPTYSCRGVVNSLEVAGISRPLGRFDPSTATCVFEWYNSVRIAPILSGEAIEVLAITAR
jgi:hypothetical protein